MQCNTMQLDSRDGSTHIASFLLFSPFPSLAYIMIIYIEQVTNSYIDIIPLTEVVKYHVATVALDVAQLADASGIKINTLSVRLDSSHSIFFFPRGFFAPLKREYIHIYVIHIPPFFLSFFFFSLSLSQGTALRITAESPTSIKINQARIVAPFNTFASNGLIHAIDKVCTFFFQRKVASSCAALCR